MIFYVKKGNIPALYRVIPGFPPNRKEVLFFFVVFGSRWAIFKTFRGAENWLRRMEGK